MERRFEIRSTSAWPGKVFIVAFFCAALYGVIRDPESWVAIFALFVFVVATPLFFMPSYVVLDYDTDRIEVKRWIGTRYDLTRRDGLGKAKAIQIDVDTGGDASDATKKYIVFDDGEEIELPEFSKDIEHLLSRWYEQYFYVQLPILRNRLNWKGQRV